MLRLWSDLQAVHRFPALLVILLGRRIRCDLVGESNREL
ncbi:rCG22279 [Rattus norvegicus]|uniref:RCG22279 n=1 Tax=Rattus norvegicus TaxID=10116 RepID=A6INB7_RAT|nr:rCG22279 [Rattus norvegicus]